MKKTIALMLAMLFALCAFATTAFADETTTVANNTTTTKADATTTVKSDDVTDGFDETTTVKSTTTTKADTTTTTVADSTTTTKADSTTTTKADSTTTTTELIGTLAPGQTAYEGQDEEGKTTTKKAPAKVESAIPSTGSGVVVPAIALAVLAAGTVAVIKTKKED